MIFQEEKQKEAGHKMHTGIINLLGMTNFLDHKILQIETLIKSTLLLFFIMKMVQKIGLWCFAQTGNLARTNMVF